VAVLIVATVTAAVAVLPTLSAGAATQMAYDVHSTGVEYATSAGTSTTYPGRLELGDRIFGRDALLERNRTIGYDNGICTVTFDTNVQCEYVEVFAGKGEFSVTWLWIHRTQSAYGPPHFSGIITGGNGAYTGAHGEFHATVLANGDLRVNGQID
jgi:hypothetical protein